MKYAQGIDPLFDSGMRGWIYNHAKKNYWRVATWYDFDDLLQDGFVCFWKCRTRYKDVTERKHLMSLVKITFTRHLIDLANKATLERTNEVLVSQTVPDGVTEQDWAERLLGSEAGEQELVAHLAKAPPEVAKVIALMVSDYGIRRLRNKRVKNPDGLRESLNDTLCRLLRLPRENNLVVGARQYIEYGLLT